MDSRYGLQRRDGGGGISGGSAGGSPALTGVQSRRKKMPPRPADYKLQIIIIGSRGVGKTSLMERFTDDTFCEACKSTVGVDFKIKTVELRGKKIRLQICLCDSLGSQGFVWPRDTAGQERFNSITSAYYRGAKGIVLVYDITKQETFDDLPKWMKMIDKYASEDAELLLVGNKLDCETDRTITRQQGERFTSRISGMRFCEASAKDNFNVDEIFLKLVDDILSKMPLEVPSKALSAASCHCSQSQKCPRSFLHPEYAAARAPLHGPLPCLQSAILTRRGQHGPGPEWWHLCPRNWPIHLTLPSTTPYISLCSSRLHTVPEIQAHSSHSSFADYLMFRTNDLGPVGAFGVKVPCCSQQEAGRPSWEQMNTSSLCLRK
ncbi:hypothetical protein AGOR_G00174240 [Albula goreensis]|uniref:Ras-related protein Rab-12 n=1 Tax=Albula goreensis TaxID=1534307 RepID=A0A8T3CUF2_9TELE|nr:hypothetical protein AGOR_G00174240 [Albula goreensis]